MKRYLEALMDGRDLPRDEAASLLTELAATGSAQPAAAGAILALLRRKGETPDEIAGFADAMRGLAVLPRLPGDEPLLDIVGTGGDASSSYNISTGSALLAAACGMRIAKHGNRSISSICGSADVLEALGLPLPLSEHDAAECLARTGFTFLFAPYYHPAMAALAPVRKALGVRTIFNVLGPLSNPARPAYGVIGAFSPHAARTMAAALAALPIERYFVVHGMGEVAGWDEATTAGEFMLLDVRPGRVEESTRDPRDCGLARCRASDLRGGDARHNASALRASLSGTPGPLRDTLVLGAALALEVRGRADGPGEAVRAAELAIADGRASAFLDDLHAFGHSLSKQRMEAVRD